MAQTTIWVTRQDDNAKPGMRIASQQQPTIKCRRKFQRKVKSDDFILFRNSDWKEPEQSSPQKVAQAKGTAIKYEKNTYIR